MVKLAKYLSEKRMRLIDMFRILDKQNKFELDKTEFIRRMKVIFDFKDLHNFRITSTQIILKLFEPRLTLRDINNIARNLSSQDTIYYRFYFIYNSDLKQFQNLIIYFFKKVFCFLR